jgi:hypothetical protein
MSNLNAIEPPIVGTARITPEFLLQFHAVAIANTLGTSEEVILKLFERPTHKIKVRTKTHERPAGPLQLYDGPLTSQAFFPWAVEYARTRLVDRLFSESQKELIELSREGYHLNATDAWKCLQIVQSTLPRYGKPLDQAAFVEWVKQITAPTHVVLRCHQYRIEVRKIIKRKLDGERYESNRGLCDQFEKLKNQVDDLEQQVWLRCASDSERLTSLTDRELHDAVVALAFGVADSWRDQAIRERKISGGQNIEDLTGWKPASRGESGHATLETGHDGDECSSWEPNSAGLQPTKAPSHPKMVDRLVIGYRIVDGAPCRDLSYGNPRSRDFIPAVGKKQEPLQAVETDEWVTAVLRDGPIKLADLKRRAKAEKSWGRDRITSSVKRLGLVKSGLWVRLPEWRNVRAA